jgi:uncharacterized protein (TIGR02145 family)
MKQTLRICFYIFLVILNNNCSKNSNGTVSVVPVPPSNLAATIISDSQINLSWTDNSTNETGFKIERKLINGTYSVVNNTPANITSYSDIGLTANTSYTFRIYSYNDVGNSPTYSNEVTITTNAGASVTICAQIWSTRNLEVTKYRNGDPIPQSNQAQWASLTTGAWRYYNDDSTYGPKYGKLYNWFAVNDSRGLAPTGWHIPSETEWTSLSNCLGGNSVAGGKLKAISPLWFSPNIGATNSSGFTALPGGCSNNIGLGVFYNQGGGGHWWSSTMSTTTNSKDIILTTDNASFVIFTHDNRNGFSVRCLKD